MHQTVFAGTVSMLSLRTFVWDCNGLLSLTESWGSSIICNKLWWSNIPVVSFSRVVSTTYTHWGLCLESEVVCFYFQCQSYCGVHWFTVWKISSTRTQDKKNPECVPWHTCSCLPLLHLSQWSLVSLHCMAPALKRFFQILVLFSPLLSGVADHPFLHILVSCASDHKCSVSQIHL